jgi:hypothetical protein
LSCVPEFSRRNFAPRVFLLSDCGDSEFEAVSQFDGNDGFASVVSSDGLIMITP